MSKPIKLDIPLKPPSVNDYWEKNKWGGMMVGKEGKQFKQQFQMFVMMAKTGLKKPLKSRLKMRIELYFKDNRRRDIDNYCKGILDAMSGLIFDDDEQIDTLLLKKHKGSGVNKIEIVIYEVPESKEGKLF